MYCCKPYYTRSWSLCHSCFLGELTRIINPYYITLCHADRHPYISVWPIARHARLPVIGVPLSYPDPDVALDLGKMVAAVYEQGRYDAQIDYREAVPPLPLTVDEEGWVADLLEPYR